MNFVLNLGNFLLLLLPTEKVFYPATFISVFFMLIEKINLVGNLPSVDEGASVARESVGPLDSQA